MSSKHAYWVEFYSHLGSLSRVSLFTAEAPEVLFDRQWNSVALDVTSDSVFWEASNEIRRAQLSDPTSYVVVAAGRAFILRADETWVYWSDLSGPLSRVDTRGDEAAVLAQKVHGFAAVGDQVYFSVTGMVIELDPSNGRERVLWTGSETHAVAADESDVFFSGDAALQRCTLRTGRCTVLADSEPGRIALDESHVYWSTTAGVWRQPRRGGESELFVVDESVRGFAIGASELVWSDGNTISAVAK